MVEKQSKDIYSIGIACIFLSTFLSLFLGMGSFLMYDKSGNDTYIVATIGGIISLGLFYIFNYIFTKNNKENIYKLNESLFGKKIGIILNLLLFTSFFIISCFILYNISNFLNIEYLPEGSDKLLKALILVSLIYISSKSLPEIIRANQIFAFTSIILIIIDILGLYSKFDISNMEPILDSTRRNLLESTILYIVLSIVPFTMLLITSKNRIKDSNKCSSTIFKMVVFTNIFQIIIILVTILILGKEYISTFRFPEYTALKQFSLFNMLERVENILSLQFYFNSFSILSLLFDFMIKFLPNLSIKKYYSIIISIILFFITSLWFKDGISFTSILDKYIIYVILIGMMLPNLITFFRLVKNNKIVQKNNKIIANDS